MKAKYALAVATLTFFLTVPTGTAQITSLTSDGIMHAPYHGTITSLRECTNDIGYGEVRNHVEPVLGGPLQITDANLQVWVVGTWDRSVLRFFRELDASGTEVDLTGTSMGSPALVPKGPHTFTRLSFKAIGVNTLGPQRFTVHFRYNTTGGLVDVDRTFTVAATTGSFCPLPGLSEAFQLGTPILDVSVGNARLTVPVGRTADLIGAAFIDNLTNIGNNNSAISRRDCLLPGAAETLFIMNSDHFQTTASANGPNKTNYGTPWAGHLTGYRTDSLILGPDATRYDSLTGNVNGLRRIDFVRPFALAQGTVPSQRYNYDGTNRVIEIRDHATPANVITLTRAATTVTVTTSDGRGWVIQNDAVTGWTTGVVPNSGNGARFFSRNSAGRITQVRDATNSDVMYEFTYTNDAQGNPTVLNLEKRFVDGALETAIEHEIVSASLHRRKEFVATGEYRQSDISFDTASSLNHRLASIKVYEDPQTGAGGLGTSHTTTYTHDVNDLSGTMVITRVDLPDGSFLTHEYDAPSAAPSINFGFRTKTTRTLGVNSLVLYDAEYEFFYLFQGATTRVFHRPRIVKQRDGRGAVSEVTFDYENGDTDQTGDTLPGEQSNFLLSRTGPTITLGTSGTRAPEVRYTYSTSQRTLTRQETRFDSGASDFRRIDYAYDSLLRLISQAVDPLGVNSVTQYAYCDTAATQDRITADPDGYWTRRRFDDDGRVEFEQRFLTANPGSLATPCADPSGPFYQTQFVYDTNGRLFQQVVDNKDQAGTALTPATITTEHTYDRLGRLTLRVVDPSGIGSESNFDYNWQSDVEREFDTSGRGITREFEGRGLVDNETPLATGETPDTNLTTFHTYDSLGNRQFTDLPTGATLETLYDDFSRVEQQIRTPGPDGGNEITTTYTYDAANNVTRTVVDEATVGTLSDATALFDEGSFNYESRQRLTAGSDGSGDPVTQRMFDWAGNVIEERSLGDTTVPDHVITTDYDGANRVETVTDSEGGTTTFTRDKRGNVTEQTVMLDGSDDAVSTTEYDALNRAFHITGPEDSAAGRPDRLRFYDSRGNLLRETLRDAADVAKMTTIFGYDNAGRQRRILVQQNAAATIPDIFTASVTANRVTDLLYDADGKLTDRTVYNNNSATPRTTTTTHDTLGRVDTVTDPSGSFADDNYATDGRLDNRVINDGVSSRTFTYEYDGHDRVITQTAVGTPNLITDFDYDGLDRQVFVNDPRGLITETGYDLAGRRDLLIEDSGGAQERQTAFDYNRLGQLITQTAMNATGGGGTLADQETRFRYDSFGRMTRTLYPDNTTDVSEAQIAGCMDCLRMEYDEGGRMTSRTDQRGLVSTMTYDKRSLLRTSTTGTDLDTYDYDALSRLALAQRGTTTNPDAASSSVMAYNDLGDLESETQTLFEGTPRLVDYGYDQAGNRLAVNYPSGPVVGSTPTAINQVDALTLNASPLADYQYAGRVFQARITTTTTNGTFTYDPGYDSHRRIDSIVNSFTPSGGSPTTIASYTFTRDNNGNPLSQTAAGQAPFTDDDRTFTVDRLNRLTATIYVTTSETESQTLDRVGNRESHTPRGGSPVAYTLGNSANEYGTIGGSGVTYDNAGNLTVDETGRQYFYDEQNRLTQIRAPGGATILANYAYDGLGRRVRFEDPVAGIVTRYYYDGPNVIEERDGSDARVRYHVNGAQYVDEHVASFDDSSGTFAYYLHNDLYTVVGTGDADGNITIINDYGAYGIQGAAVYNPACTRGDMDDNGVVNGLDIDLFIKTLLNYPTGDPQLDCAGDVNGDGVVTKDDIDSFVVCVLFGECPPLPPSPERVSGFTLHGRPVDVIDGGNLILQYNRARYYDIKNGRWLHRDPIPYGDGQNLYEAWRGNPGANPDPSGEGILTWILAGAYHASDWQFIKDGGPLWAAGGFFQGAGRTVATGSVELGRTVGYPLGLAENPGAAQLRLIQLVNAEYDLGGTASESPSLVMLRASGQGIVDFFGATNVATAATGEAIVFGEGGQVLIYEAGGFERFQVGVAGVGQFAGTVSGLAAPALNPANQVIVGRAGLSAFTRLAPETPTTQAFVFRAGLAIETKAFAARAIQASEAEAFAIFVTRRGITPGTAAMETVAATGRAGEFSARSLLETQGEIIVLTQFKRGAANRGFDFLSAARGPNGLEVFLNEVKNSTGLQFPSGLTALGLNRAGTFDANLARAQAAVAEQVTDNALRTGILGALRQQNYSIRIIGRPGIRITPRTESLIQRTAGTTREVIILEALP